MEIDHKNLKLIFIAGLVLLVLLVGLFFLNIFGKIKSGDTAGKAINDVCTTDADCGDAGLGLECKNNICVKAEVFVLQTSSCADDNQGTVTFNKQDYKNLCVGAGVGDNGALQNLKKYSCDSVNHQLVMEIYKCNNGCKDGVCIS